MIIPSKIGVTLICDICGEEIDGFLDFEDAVAHKRSEGWKSEKYRGEWQDICPECQDVDERYNSYIKTAEIYKQTLLIMKGAAKDE